MSQPVRHFERFIVEGGGYRYEDSHPGYVLGLLALRDALYAGRVTRYVLEPGGTYYMPTGADNVSAEVVVSPDGLTARSTEITRRTGLAPQILRFTMPDEVEWLPFGPTEVLERLDEAITLHSLVRHVPSTERLFRQLPPLPPAMPSQI